MYSRNLSVLAFAAGGKSATKASAEKTPRVHSIIHPSILLTRPYRYCSRIVSSNGICRGFAFKYGKFLLPPRFLTALSVPKVPPREHTVSSQKKVYWIFVILTTPLLADYNHFTAVDSRHSRLKHIPFYHLRRFYHDIQDKGSLFP